MLVLVWVGKHVGSSRAGNTEGVVLAFPQAMITPHEPRWINRSNVDSGSMLSAFLWYRSQCSESERRELECLYSIAHRGKDTILINGMLSRPQKIEGPVPSIPCTAEGCERCIRRRGGYQFRWCSWKWMQRYTELVKRRQAQNPQNETTQGIWLPGDAENCARPSETDA